MNVLTWLLFGSFLQACLGANILVFLGVSLKSNLFSIASILEQLVPQHNVTLYIGPSLKYKHPHIHVKNLLSYQARAALTAANILKDPCAIDSYGVFLNIVLQNEESFFDDAFKYPDIQDLMKSKEKYDLIMVNGIGTEQYLVFSHKFNAPVIQISPSIMLPWISNDAGNPTHWESDLSFMVPEQATSIFGRIKRYVKTAIVWNRYYTKYLPVINKVIGRHLPGTPSIESMLSKTALVFLNTHGAMGVPRPSVPSIVEIGGIHIATPKPLPDDLSRFINGSEHGVVYFSLGSTVPESTMNEYLIKSLLNTFRGLKERVLWKWDGKRHDIPENVWISKWFPQQSILNHPKVKLFITQGGMLSLLEASVAGVPVLIMPVMFDQITNAHLVEEKGYGMALEFCDFTEDRFKQKVTELVSNPKYKQKTKQISEIIRSDLPYIKDKVKFWVDFVIKTKGQSIVQDLRTQFPWWQSMPVDIFLGLLFILFFTIALIVEMSYIIYVYVFKKKPKDKVA